MQESDIESAALRLVRSGASSAGCTDANTGSLVARCRRRAAISQALTLAAAIEAIIQIAIVSLEIRFVDRGIGTGACDDLALEDGHAVVGHRSSDLLS